MDIDTTGENAIPVQPLAPEGPSKIDKAINAKVESALRAREGKQREKFQRNTKNYKNNEAIERKQAAKEKDKHRKHMTT